ncbi:MAG: glycosyltransferase family 39 protein [Steroidobacteraceae bacterium]
MNHRWFKSIGLILLVAIAIRAIALLYFEGDVHDGQTRILTAMQWLENGVPFFGRTMWPEGNYLLPAAILWIWPDTFWAPRLLYATVAISNIWLAFLLADEVFGRKSAVVTGWIVALMPYHILASANSAMSELPYISLILAAVLFAAKHARTPRLQYAAAAGICVALASTFRIDGVVWGLPLSLSIALSCWQHRAKAGMFVGHLFVFGLLGLLYIAAITAKWAQLYPGDVGYILGQAKLNAEQFFAGGTHLRWPPWLYQTYTIIYWPAAIAVLLTPIVALLGFVGWLPAFRNSAARPIAYGIAIIMLWLIYASFTHSILAYWRYALILAVMLSIFVFDGANRIASRWPRVTSRTLFSVGAVAALLFQAAVTLVTFKDFGVITRQLSIASPIRPGQFDSRVVLNRIREIGGHHQPVLISPHALEYPYLRLKRIELEKAGTVIAQSYYLPNSQLVHTSESLRRELVEKMQNSDFVVTSMAMRELGLRDGLSRELVNPVCTDRTPVCLWEGIILRPIERAGTLTLWQVERDQHGRHG